MVEHKTGLNPNLKKQLYRIYFISEKYKVHLCRRKRWENPISWCSTCTKQSILTYYSILERELYQSLSELELICTKNLDIEYTSNHCYKNICDMLIKKFLEQEIKYIPTLFFHHNDDLF